MLRGEPIVVGPGAPRVEAGDRLRFLDQAVGLTRDVARRDVQQFGVQATAELEEPLDGGDVGGKREVDRREKLDQSSAVENQRDSSGQLAYLCRVESGQRLGGVPAENIHAALDVVPSAAFEQRP